CRERLDQVRGLGGHVQACRHPDASERLLLLESLADEREDRHLAGRPLDSLATASRESEVLHVAFHLHPSSQSSSNTPTTTCAIASAAAFEAISTSPCETEVPAAFVTNERPSTRIRRARAATASGTIDMPTTVAPARRRNSVSAGVSNEGPGTAAYTPSATRSRTAPPEAEARNWK